MIGIIGAMDEEVAMLKEKLTEVQVETKAAMDFYKGKLEGKDVVVVRSGIGKVNAGICSQILVDLYQVDGIVNTGIAGSLRNEINIGDLVLSTVAVQHDVDAGGFGYPAGEIPQLGVKGEALPTIDGTPPNLFNKIKGDAFAPRNRQALAIDFEEEPPYFEVSETHKAKTWYLDPRAPKIEPPKSVQQLRQKMRAHK